MKIQLDNKQITNRFLTPISKISEECSVNVTDKNVFTLVNDQNGSTILYCKLQIDTGLKEDETVKLNIKDIRKLQRVFECITADNFEVEVDDNASLMKYKSKELSFKLHLVTDSVIKKVRISLEKINSLTFGSEFALPHDKLTEVLKGSVFATDTNKIYFFTKDGNVFAELTDKAAQDLDSITFNITDSFTGEEIQDPLPFSLEFLRILSALKADNIKVKINNTYKILMFEVIGENSTLKYIISAFTK